MFLPRARYGPYVHLGLASGVEGRVTVHAAEAQSEGSYAAPTGPEQGSLSLALHGTLLQQRPSTLQRPLLLHILSPSTTLGETLFLHPSISFHDHGSKQHVSANRQLITPGTEYAGQQSCPKAQAPPSIRVQQLPPVRSRELSERIASHQLSSPRTVLDRL